MMQEVRTEEKRTSKIPHNIIMEDRKSLSISGVVDVDSFDEQTVVLFTDLGELCIRGSNLHINKISVETGELTMEGNISSLAYTEQMKKSGSMLSKLFR